MGRGRVRWGRVTSRLLSRLVPMRVSVSVSRAILGGLHRGAWGQPWQPSYTFIFASGDTAKIKLAVRDEKAADTVRARADEQEFPCAIVQVLVAHARFLQDFVYNLHAVDTCYVSLWICGEANAIH